MRTVEFLGTSNRVWNYYNNFDDTGSKCRKFEGKYRREQKAMHWKCWVGRKLPLINIQLISSSQRGVQGKEEISPRESWKEQIAPTLDVSKKLEAKEEALQKEWEQDQTWSSAAVLPKNIGARSDGYAMVAETTGDIPVLAAHVDKKGEAQHVTPSKLRADHPHPKRDYTFSLFSHFHSQRLVITRPLLPWQ